MRARTINAVTGHTFVQSYPGEHVQARAVRAALASLLEGCPCADDVILIISELAANAAVHSRSSAPGGRFTVRSEVQPGDYVWVEVEDEGGPWTRHGNTDGRAHGLDLVAALAGAANWGVEGNPDDGHIVWARLDWREPA